MHPSKESGGDGLLTVWGRVDIVEGFQQGADGGQEDGAVWLVNGTWQETVPERRSQVACGLSDSRRSHCLATMAGRSTIFVPGGGSVAREEAKVLVASSRCSGVYCVRLGSNPALVQNPLHLRSTLSCFSLVGPPKNGLVARSGGGTVQQYNRGVLSVHSYSITIAPCSLFAPTGLRNAISPSI